MINVKNIAYSYKKQKPLYDHLNIDLDCNHIIGLLGKNGSGKTTLLKLFSGLLSPNKGKLSVDDYIPFKRQPSFLKQIFLITEEMYIPEVSIRKYIKMYAPFYEKFELEKMKKILIEFELNEKENLNSLSFGQRKKFLIGFALATNCKYLLLDEPTNGLDIPSKSVFRKVLVNSVSEEQLVIISTHQVKDIETIIDKVVIVNSGKIALNENIFNLSKKYQFKYLETLDNEEVLYREKNLSGYKAILKNSNSNETNIDLELLFNAVTSNKINTF